MSTPRPRRSRLALALAATFGLVVALAQGVVGPASAHWLPTPTSMTVTAYSDPAVIAAHLGGAPAGAIPPVLAAVDDSFIVKVSLRAGAGGSHAAAFRHDQAVTLTATGPGALPSAARMIWHGQTSATFVVGYSAAATGVTITAMAGPPSGEVSGTSNAFDINKFLTFVPEGDASLGNGTAGADGAGCAVVDRDNPICGVVVLPRGASSDVALTLGPCPSGEACKNGALVTQVIADLTAGGVNIYDRTHPARMDLICDKTLCGKAGVPSFTALWSQSAFGALEPVPACAKKGVINATGPAYCTDYRTSRRDGAGDLHLVVLFLDDVRGSI